MLRRLEACYKISAITAGAPAKISARLERYQLKRNYIKCPNAPRTMASYKLMTLKAYNRG